MKTKVYKIKVVSDRSCRIWWVRIRARNGRIVATTENYPTRHTALKTARALAAARLEVEG